jgi:hypothetical protein
LANVQGAAKLKGQMGPRLLLVFGVGIAVVTVGLLAGSLTLIALDGNSGRGIAAAASPTPTASGSATARVTPTPPVVASASAGASPTPAVTPEPGTGGDQPTDPLPPTVGDIPENVGVSAELLALKDQLTATISDYETRVGIDVGLAVTDLQTGETISINGNVLHKTGCVINMFGLFAAVDEFQSGNASPSGLEYSIKKGIGGSYPPEVKNFLQAIYGYYPDGVAHARELMSGWGMKLAWYDHIPYYGGDNPPANILTPLESTGILTRLWNDQLFNEQWTDYTISVLRDSYAYADYILPKYLPWYVTVGHKIGYYWDYDGWVNNDVGIVSWAGPDGSTKAYAISYFSQNAPSEAAGYTFGQRLSLDTYNFMVNRYGVYQPPAPPTEQPTPVPTASPSPTPTAQPTPSLTPVPTASPTPTLKPTASPTAPTPTQH